uniref:helix-turn-helix domain-containing protein n=1 Tax=Salmonella enterica TaxID=28901 RepID=UPI0026671281
RRTASNILGGEEATSFADSERAFLRRALARADGNATKAAKELGIGRATLYRRMEWVDCLAIETMGRPDMSATLQTYPFHSTI